MLKHGKRVNSPRNWKRGDCFIYGSDWPGKHVAVYIGGGYVISHGSEAGPFKLHWNYRPDLMEVRRYI
jgi:cell wall-associated NlpC family hydrolase